ncbi:MAG: hypothetical protein ACPGUV_13125 [Polyangiales bacterium]
MHHGRNPTRRNRNIGTAKQGLGQDNRLVIPWPWHQLEPHWATLGQAVRLDKAVQGHTLTLYIEAVTAGFVHACSVDDVLTVLAHVPPRHLTALDMVIWRQPTRKQAILQPVWGRFIYHAEIKRDTGTAIILEAAQPHKAIRWKRTLGPEGQKELARLRADGHVVREDKRHFAVVPSVDSIRATQLYRTLPHELGHLVDWHTQVTWPAGDDDARWRTLDARYPQKPPVEREQAAHRYADALSREWMARGICPFTRRLDHDALQQDGLDSAWFGQASTGVKGDSQAGG